MPEYSYEIVRQSNADAAALFGRLADIPRWHEWAGRGIPRSIRERVGAPDPNGVGAIRKLGAPGFWAREEITEFLPPVRHSYILVSGVPARRYRATVEFEANPGGGTTIRWRARFEPLIPGTGRVLCFTMKTIVAGVAKRLAAASEG